MLECSKYEKCNISGTGILTSSMTQKVLFSSIKIRKTTI